jgi:hypothetical protein
VARFRRAWRDSLKSYRIDLDPVNLATRGFYAG